MPVLPTALTVTSFFKLASLSSFPLQVSHDNKKLQPFTNLQHFEHFTMIRYWLPRRSEVPN